jgi:hypothetical protein
VVHAAAGWGLADIRLDVGAWKFEGWSDVDGAQVICISGPGDWTGTPRHECYAIPSNVPIIEILDKIEEGMKKLGV